MSDTVELTVHPASMCNRLTVHFTEIRHLYTSPAGGSVFVAGTYEDGDGAVLVTESADEIRRLCAEKPIPCEEGDDDA